MPQYFLQASDNPTQTPLSDIGFDVAGTSFNRSRVLADGNAAGGFKFTFNTATTLYDLFTDSAGAGDQEILLIGDIPPNSIWVGLIELKVQLREGVDIAVHQTNGWSNTGLDSVTTDTGAPSGYSNTAPYALLVQVVGTTYRAKFWQDAGGLAGLQTNEPAGWDYEGTAAAPLTGKIGINKNGGGCTHIGIGTEGDSAPWGPVAQPNILPPVVGVADQITSDSARLNWTPG